MRDVDNQEFAMSVAAETLPDDFNLKRDLLRCEETDRIWNSAHSGTRLQNQALEQTIPQVDNWIETGRWRDAYELMRLASDRNLVINSTLHEALGTAIVDRGIVAFGQVDIWRQRGAPRLAELGDFVHFMISLNRHYPERPQQLEQAVGLSEVFFDVLTTEPRAEYELIETMHDVGWSTSRKEQYIMQLLQFHPDIDALKARFVEFFETERTTDPTKALTRTRLGYRVGLISTDELQRFFEQAIEDLDIKRIVMSKAGSTSQQQDWREADTYFTQDPASVVGEILPDANKRQLEMLGRRTAEFVIQYIDQVRGTPREYSVLADTVDSLSKLNQGVPGELVERLVQIVTFQDREAYTPSLYGGMSTLFRLNAGGHLSSDDLMIAFDHITERYLKPVIEARWPGEPGEEVTQEKIDHFFSEFHLSEAGKSYGVTKFIRKLGYVLTERATVDPSTREKQLSEIVPIQDLLEMIKRFEHYQIEPYQHLITAERRRLVMTYKREEFREPDRYYRNSELPVYLPRVQHPEKGPRSMIALIPLQAAAFSEVTRQLKIIIEHNNVGKFIDWQILLASGEVVPFLRGLDEYYG